MSHTQTKLPVSFRQLMITSSIVFLSVASVLLFSAFKNESSFKNLIQIKSKTHSSPLKGTLSLNLLGEGNVSGNGIATHLGRFDFSAQDDESGFPYISGKVILTAANGDQIFADHSGTVPLPVPSNGVVRIPFLHTITGGTGRFVGATGEFLIVSIANLITNTATGEMTGNISY